MADDTLAPARKLIIPKGVMEAGGSNVVEIPEGCEDSRVLIAKLQAKYGRPPRYYPPLTNPENRFERRVGNVCVGLGMPPLSPLQEERANYRPSFSQYGPQRTPPEVSYEPSYFGQNTTHGSRSISGKFDYCPSSTPIPSRERPATEFPSPKLSPIVMGRDIFAPDPSVYQSAYTPPRLPSPPPPSPPRAAPCALPQRRMPSPGSDRSCSFGEISGMLDDSSRGPPRRSPQRVPQSVPQRRAPSPCSDQSCSFGDISGMVDDSRGRRPSPPRAAPPPRASPPRAPPPRAPPARAPQRRPPSPSSDGSCSLDDISGLMDSRAIPGSLLGTPDSIRGISNVYDNAMGVPGTPVPQELDFSVLNSSLIELEAIEIDELMTVQDRMRNFQDARRDLVLTILSLQEVDLPSS